MDGQPREPLVVHCSDCHHEWAPAFGPIAIDLMVKAMNGQKRCPVCKKSKINMGWYPKATAEGQAMAWLHNGDTGISSETIWSVMTGRQVKRTGVPQDPADFGRCYRLLKVMPSWRSRMSEVATAYPGWAPLVAVWDELTALYEEEMHLPQAPKLYARMKDLVE